MKFFDKLKEIIKNSAKEAVLEAEKSFSSGEGAKKKQTAIAFVTNALPFPALIKPIIAAILNAFIDSAIETAVKAINNETKTI